jgi:hypothetical protein
MYKRQEQYDVEHRLDLIHIQIDHLEKRLQSLEKTNMLLLEKSLRHETQNIDSYNAPTTPTEKNDVQPVQDHAHEMTDTMQHVRAVA